MKFKENIDLNDRIENLMLIHISPNKEIKIKSQNLRQLLMLHLFPSSKKI